MEAKRDWGYAYDYVRAMWLMLQQDTSDDYVRATGETHSVREFVEYASTLLGYNIKWEGKGLDEKGIDEKSGQVLISIDEAYYRPSEVDVLLGDSTKAKNKLNWEAEIKFKDLIDLMMKGEFEERGLNVNDYLA